MNDYSIIGIICARGGSKGVPKKNIMPLGGKPLIAHSIETLKSCPMIKRIIISTDDPAIAETARAYGAEVPFLRPAELAGDKISKIPALQHAIRFLEEQGEKIDIIIDLDPTAPFRTVQDIMRCVEELQKTDTDSVVTVCEAHHNPYFNMLEQNHDGYLELSKKPASPVTCRQDAPKVYQMNSGAFAAWRDTIMEKGTYFTGRMRGVVMPEDQSLMIDTPLEFDIAEMMLNGKEEKNNRHASMIAPGKKQICDLFSLYGKTAIVTGGVGIIGPTYVDILASAGANVVIVDINKEACDGLAMEMTKKYGNRSIGVACDITKKDEVEKLVKTAVREFGHVDVLVNNAATKSKNFFAPMEDFPLEDWEKVMAVNCTGMFLCSQAVGAQMVRQGSGGVIVNISSTYGNVAPDQRIYADSNIRTPLVYAASKSAVLNMTRYLAAYWGKNGIRVNTLTPGGVRFDKIDRDVDAVNQTNRFVENYSARVPLGRMARRDEYKGAMLFLCSDASAYMTGANLVVDGGWTCW